MFIIDGCNVAGDYFRLFSKVEAGQLTLRQAFQITKRAVVSGSGRSIIIVFDSSVKHSIYPDQLINGQRVDIHFSSPEKTADEYIIKLIQRKKKRMARSKRKKRSQRQEIIIVVTDDKELQQKTQHEGLPAWSIKDFFDYLGKSR